LLDFSCTAVQILLTYSVTRTAVQLADQTPGRSGGAGENDAAERAWMQQMTPDLMPTTPGGSQMTASHGGRYYYPSPVKRSSE